MNYSTNNTCKLGYYLCYSLYSKRELKTRQKIVNNLQNENIFT